MYRYRWRTDNLHHDMLSAFRCELTGLVNSLSRTLQLWDIQYRRGHRKETSAIEVGLESAGANNSMQKFMFDFVRAAKNMMMHDI